MERQERWRELCREAEQEQDSERLIHLTQEINRLLDEKQLKTKGLYGGRANIAKLQGSSHPGTAMDPQD